MKLKITIDCDNAAFANEDGEYTRESIAGEVDKVIGRAKSKALTTDDITIPLVDSNGNRCGVLEIV